MGMHSQVTVLIWAFLVAPGLLAGQEQSLEGPGKRDAYWWEKLRPMEKLAFVDGYAGAMTHAHVTTRVIGSAIIEDTREDSPCSSTKERAVTAFVGRAKADFDYFHITLGQLSDGLDKFYADFRNQRIEVYDAMDIIRQQIKGVDDSVIQRQILLMRKFHSKSE